MSKSGLVVLETLDEAVCFADSIQFKDAQLTTCQALCMCPNISGFLAKRNIQSVSPAEFIDVQSHREVMDKCEELETHVLTYIENQDLKNPESYFVNAYFHYMRLIWRHLLWDIEILGSYLWRHNFERVFAFQYDKQVTLSPWIEDNQRYMGAIAARICHHRGIQFEALMLPIETVALQRPGNLPTGLANLMDQCAFWLVRLMTLLLSRKQTLLVPSFKYNLNLLCDELKARASGLKTGLFYIGASGFKQILQALALLAAVLGGIRIKKASIGYPIDYAVPIVPFAHHFRKNYDHSVLCAWLDAVVQVVANAEPRQNEYKGVQIADLLVAKLKNDLNPYMLQVAYQAFGLEKALAALCPKLIVSQMGFEICGALGHAAKTLKIPSVLISHGSHVAHEEKCAAREHKILARNLLVGDFTYSAVQSPLARKMALNMIDDPGRVVNIPPTLWGRPLKRGKGGSDQRLTIVHAGTYKLRHNRRFIYETTDEFVAGVKELCQAVACFPRLNLTVKMRPDNYELTVDTLKAFLPLAPNITIETEKPFSEVLQTADLLVSFSSTTIEEALSNRIPVLLYGGQGRYAHIPVTPFQEKDDIAKAVTFVQNRKALDAYLAALDYAGEAFRVPDQAFAPYVFTAGQVVQPAGWLLAVGGIVP